MLVTPRASDHPSNGTARMADPDHTRVCPCCHETKDTSQFMSSRHSPRCKTCYPKRNKSCPSCGKEFFAHRNRRFCSEQCKVAISTKRKPTSNCPHCGTTFSLTRRSKKYCSAPCFFAAATGRVKGRRVSPDRERTCIECGKIELVRKDNPAKRCSPCARGIFSPINGRKGGAVKKARARPSTLGCEHCGRGFSCANSNLSRTRFCSRACRHLASTVERNCKQCGVFFRIAKSRLGENSNASGNFCSRPCYNVWLSDPDSEGPRGSRWKAISAEAVRRNPFCAECGTPDSLQVHHIIPYRLTCDNGQENLVPICRTHHYRYDREFRALERKFDGSLTYLYQTLRAEFDNMQASILERHPAIHVSSGSEQLKAMAG